MVFSLHALAAPSGVVAKHHSLRGTKLGSTCSPQLCWDGRGGARRQEEGRGGGDYAALCRRTSKYRQNFSTAT